MQGFNPPHHLAVRIPFPLDPEFPFETTEDVEYADAQNRIALKIEAPFRTDFASIPRLFWSILSPIGPYSRAALVHDMLYREGTNRLIADSIFLSIMERDRVPRLTRMVMYYAVRIFGRRFYYKCRNGGAAK